MNGENTLQDRLNWLEAGEPLEACVAGLPEEEAELVRIAASFRSIAFPSRAAGSVAMQRSRVMRAAAESNLLAVLAGNETAAQSSYKTASLSSYKTAALSSYKTAVLSSYRSALAALSSFFTSLTTRMAALPRPASMALAGLALVFLFGLALLAGRHGPAGPGVAGNLPYTVNIPVVNSMIAAPNAQSAVVIEARGVVEVQAANGAWAVVQDRQVLQAGQRVRTGALSSAALRFYDGSQARLGASTEVSIDELNAQTDGPRVVRLTQVSGDTLHDVVPSSQIASSYQVDTPSGSGVAKGTSFSVRVRPGQLTRFDVDEGSVAVTSLNVTVVAVAGQSSTVYTGGTPTEPVFRISGEGTLTQMGDVWTIGGRNFLVNTTPGEGETVTEIVGDPQIGDWVSVEGRVLPDNTYFADRIVLLRRAAENRFSFSGTVEAIGDSEWTISGRAVGVDGDTEIDEDIETGDVVEVSGVILEGGALLAERIRKVDAAGLPFEFTGVVESIGTEAWTISGVEVAVDENTEIQGNPAVGDIVKVEGQILEDGAWLASEIKPVEEDERRFEFTGTVEQIDPWMVSGIHFDTSDATEIDEDIEVGDRVRVEGRVLDDGTWLAEEIHLLEEDDDDLRTFSFIGRVRRIDPWVIGGLDIAVDDETVIDPGIETGDMVRVRGVILPDGTLLARRIRLLDVEQSCMDVVVVIAGIDGNIITLSNGQTVELDESVVVDGELSANAVVIIRVCIGEDGTTVVVSIIIIFLPPPVTPTPPPGDDGSVTVCHIPPGNPSKAHTIQVGAGAVSAHLGHGDYLGPCRGGGGGDDDDD